MGAYGSPDLSKVEQNTNNIEKNLIYCEKCGFRFSKKIKKCPQCRTKHSQRFYNKWWFWLFVVIVIFAFYPAQNNIEDVNIQSEQTAISEDEYKSNCGTVNYTDVARNPNNYIGESVVFKGKVVQIREYRNPEKPGYARNESETLQRLFRLDYGIERFKRISEFNNLRCIQGAKKRLVVFIHKKHELTMRRFCGECFAKLHKPAGIRFRRICHDTMTLLFI